MPAGTLESVPVTTALTWSEGDVVKIEVVVPPGPSGLMGFAIGHSGQVIIPRTPGQWIVTDDERIDWPLSGYPTGGAWFVRAYNLDIYDHTIYFRFLIDELSDGGPRPVSILDIQQPDQLAPSIEDNQGL